MIRNRYVGRTFIEPKKSIRRFGVKLKPNPVKDFLNGKRVIVIDDSIVRATTNKKIISMIPIVRNDKFIICNRSPLLVISNECEKS